MNKILFLSGPTAVGKTDLGIRLARSIAEKTGFGCEIVNFDSLLFYQELSIGTAKPTPSQQAQIAHHLIDTASIREPMSAARFVAEANTIIDRLFASGTVPLLIGGSGFYLRALVKGMIETQEPPGDLREDIEERYSREGIAPFRAYLEEHDPESSGHLHENDHYRIMRAFEYHRMTGQKFSEGKRAIEEPYDFSTNDHPDWDFLHLYLDIPKEQHDGVIRRRTQAMIDRGLVDEIRSLLASGHPPTLKPLSSVGHKQVLSYLSQTSPSERDLVEQIVIATRQLAKAQRTFFRKITPKLPFHPQTDEAELTNRVFTFLNR